METNPKEQNVSSLNGVVSRALNSIGNLGHQVFALAPFYEHFDRWLMNLQNVLIDFESNQVVTVDDQFREKRSQVFSGIESALRDKRFKEVSRAEAIRSLLSSKNILLQTEQQYIVKMKEIADRKEHTIKPLMRKVEVLQEELDGVLQIRTGFLRGTSKKIKAQKEEEATLRLTSAKKELEEAIRTFGAEEEGLRGEYEHMKLKILEQTTNDQREIERLETASQIDDSVEDRRIACENLTNAINALLKRTQPVSKTENET